MTAIEIIRATLNDAEYDREDAIVLLRDSDYLAHTGINDYLPAAKEARRILSQGQVYRVVAEENTENILYNGSTSYEALFGALETVFTDRADAAALADMLNSDSVWGEDNTLTAAEVGITYYVEQLR